MSEEHPSSAAGGGKGKPSRPFRRSRGGADRGGQPGGASRGGGRVAKPVIPDDVPMLPRGAWRDIDAVTAAGLAPEVARAVSAASELEAEEPERAETLLAWAKQTAPRSAAVREALGVAAYRRGDFATAAKELAAYRRFSGRQDQNHLLADSLRATDRRDRVRELVEAMGPDVDEERRVEGWMVYAGSLADTGDALRAREVLERVEVDPVVVAEHHVRLWYLAAELSLAIGDSARAAELLEAVTTVDPEFLDASEQLGALTGEPDPGSAEGDDVDEAGVSVTGLQPDV